MIVISDTSPIRALIAIEKIKLLQQLFTEVYIPVAVQAELMRIEFLKKEVNVFLNEPWVIVKSVNHFDKYLSIRKLLDEGESEAITLAVELSAELLLIDEHKGRVVAKSENIKTLGLIGVLLKAKKELLIPAVKPELDTLIHQHGFWIEETLYKAVLLSAGE